MAKKLKRDYFCLIPPKIMQGLRSEFKFDSEVFRQPKSDSVDWGNKTFANPPFSPSITWFKKAISEYKKGKTVVFVFPIHRWIRTLIKNGAEIRNLGDVQWYYAKDGSPKMDSKEHVAAFILKPKRKPRDFWIIKDHGFPSWVSNEPIHFGDTDKEIHVREVL